MIPAILLGIRMLQGKDRALRLRLLVVVVGAGLCVLVILIVLGAWQVSRRADVRNVEQAPHPDRSGSLLYYQVADSFGGREFTRVYLAQDGQNPPVPPGLPRLPRIDEAFVSPNLAARLRADDSNLEARFSGLHVRTIGRSGLTSANQQLAYLPSTPAQLRSAERVSAFGDPAEVSETTARIRLLTLLLFIVFIGVPFAGVCAVATRLGAAARRRRLTALWMIGVPPRLLKLASATEMSVGVLGGSVLGVLGYRILAPTLAVHVDVNGVRAFAADLDLALPLEGTVVLAVLVLAIGSGALLGASPAQRSVRPTRKPRRFAPTPMAVVAVGLGLAIACAASIARDRHSLASVTLLDACAATLVVGASLSLPFVLQFSSRLVARRNRRPGVLLASRRLEADPGAMTRLGVVILPAIFAIGFAATIATQFQLHDSAPQREASFRGRQVGAVEAPTLPTSTLTTRSIRALVALPHLRSSGLDVVVASCAQLRALSGRAGLTCPSGRFVLTLTNPVAGSRLARPTPAGGRPRPTVSPSHTAVITTSSGRHVVLRAPPRSLTLEVPLPLMQSETVLIVPPNDPVLRRFGRHLPIWELTVAIPDHDPAAAARLRASVAKVDPLAEVQLAGEAEQAADAGYARYGTTAMLLALVACIVGAAGVVMTAFDAVLSQRRGLEPLLVVGAPRAVLRRVVAAEIVAPLAIAVAVAAAVAALCGRLFTASHPNAQLATSAIGISAGLGLLVAGLIGLLATSLVPSAPQRISARVD